VFVDEVGELQSVGFEVGAEGEDPFGRADGFAAGDGRTEGFVPVPPGGDRDDLRRSEGMASVDAEVVARISAVSALRARSRSAFICSRPTVRSFSTVWTSPARRSRSRSMSMIRVERAAVMASRLSVLPLPRRRLAEGIGASTTR